MKKLFTSLALLILGAVTNTAMAEYLGIIIAGTEVTTTNCSNITGPGISGTVKYDPNTKTLTLKDATITSSEQYDGIYNANVEDLQILFEGTVTINTNGKDRYVAGIFCRAKTLLASKKSGFTSVVKVNNTGSGPAIMSQLGSQIRVWYLNLTATASNYHTIFAESAAELRVLASTLAATASNTSYCAITGFTQGLSMKYRGCPMEVFDNTGHSFDNGTGRVVANGNPVASTTLYPAITIGNEPLSYMTPVLSTSSTGASAISGTAGCNWNGDKPTLTLNNFSMTGGKITVRIPNLKIETIGDCSIENTRDAVDIYADTEFLGEGTLKLTSTNSAAISTFHSADVRLGVKTLEAKGKTYGFYGQSTGKLHICKPQNITYNCKFSGEMNGDLYTGDLQLTGIDIITANRYWHPTDGFVFHNNDRAKSTGIGTNCTWFTNTDRINYYSLYVGGVHVRQNCPGYIVSRYITSGKASYESSTNTLTLDNVTIEGMEYGETREYCGIHSEIYNLTIKTIGTNNIKTKAYGILFSSNTTITGSHLNVISEENSALHSFVNKQTKLTLSLSSSQPCNFQGKFYGYNGNSNNDSTGELVITQGSDGGGALYKFAGGEANIKGITKLNLGTGVKIHSRWTWYNEEAKAVYVTDGIAKANDLDYGTWIRGDVTWTEYPIYICGEQLYGAYVGGVYRGNIYGFYNKYTKYNDANSNISYDPGSNELRLRDVTIDYTGTDKTNIGIIQTDEDAVLNIVCTGDNTLTSQTAYSALWIREGYCAIKGDGTLNTSSKFCDIYPMQGTELNFLGSVTVNAQTKGIWSNNGTNSMLVHGNATINAKTIYDIDELILGSNHAITQPAGATFSNRAVRLNGSIAQGVVIKPIPLGDVNADGFIDIADVVAVLSAMAGNPVPGNANVNGDIDILNNPVIDIADVVAVLSLMAGNE